MDLLIERQSLFIRGLVLCPMHQYNIMFEL